MVEPISTISVFAGISAASLFNDLSGNSLYDVCRAGAGGVGSGLRERINEMRDSGTLPTNHTLERGLRRAALNASLSIIEPIKAKDLADLLKSQGHKSSTDRGLTRMCRTALKTANENLKTLRRLYGHEGWDDNGRQKRLEKALKDLKVQIENLDGERDTIESAMNWLPDGEKVAGPEHLGIIMHEMVQDFLGLDYEMSECLRKQLAPRYTGKTSDFERFFPLFFAQELKNDPNLQTILLHQKLEWSAQKVQTVQNDVAEVRKAVFEQADLIMSNMRLADAKLDTLLRKEARNSQALRDVLSANWLLDAKDRNHFEGMFRDPAERVPSTVLSDDDALRFHFSSQDDAFIGREKQLKKIQDEFLSYPEKLERAKDAFRWMVISGEAGTGKSRLAQEIVRTHLAEYRHAGFAAPGMLADTSFGTANQDRFQAPILIVVDYTVGHQTTMQEFMKGWADYGRRAVKNGLPPVRIILLLRKADDPVLRDIEAGGGNFGDNLLTDGPFLDDPELFDLKNLDSDQTLELMRARIRQTADRFNEAPIDTSSDADLRERLRKFDNAERPLFALMVAHAMQRGTLPKLDQSKDEETARVELFGSYLKGQWNNYWRSQSGAGPSQIDEADSIVTPHANLMRSVTAVGGVKREDLMKRLHKIRKTDKALAARMPKPKLDGKNKFRDDLAVSIVGGRGVVEGGEVDPVPALEPDLIGECFVLMSWKEFGVGKSLWCDPEQVIRLAWQINEEETAKFIRQMAQDYPERMRNFKWFPIAESSA